MNNNPTVLDVYKQVLEERRLFNMKRFRSIRTRVRNIIRRVFKPRDRHNIRRMSRNDFPTYDQRTVSELEHELATIVTSEVFETMFLRFSSDGMYWKPEYFSFLHQKMITGEYTRKLKEFKILKEKGELTSNERKNFLELHKYLITAPAHTGIIVTWTEHEALDQKLISKITNNEIYPTISSRPKRGEVLRISPETTKQLTEICYRLISMFNIDDKHTKSTWSTDHYTPYTNLIIEITPEAKYEKPKKTKDGWEVDMSLLGCTGEISMVVNIWDE